MTGVVRDVDYQYVYDLYYRVKHACLESEIYRLDFLEWVKAGIAYNTRGIKDPTRKIAYFGQLYRKIQGGVSNMSKSDLREAVIKYYDDLFQLYQDHLEAQLREAGRQRVADILEPRLLVLLPSFANTPDICDMLDTVEVSLVNYECQHIEELRQKMATIYAIEDSLLFRSMGLLFDYGVYNGGDGVILEVR